MITTVLLLGDLHSMSRYENVLAHMNDRDDKILYHSIKKNIEIFPNMKSGYSYTSSFYYNQYFYFSSHDYHFYQNSDRNIPFSLLSKDEKISDKIKIID